MKLLFGTEAIHFLHENKVIRPGFTACDKAKRIQFYDYFSIHQITRIIQCECKLFFMVKDDPRVYCQSCNPFYERCETEDNIVMWIQTTPCNENDDESCWFTYAEKIAQEDRKKI